jgi:hypothetical protein
LAILLERLRCHGSRKLAADREAAEKLTVHRGCSGDCIHRNGILCTRGDHGGCAPIRDAVAASRDVVATT